MVAFIIIMFYCSVEGAWPHGLIFMALVWYVAPLVPSNYHNFFANY